MACTEVGSLRPTASCLSYIKHGKQPMCLQKQEGGWGSLFLHMRRSDCATSLWRMKKLARENSVFPTTQATGKWIAVYNIKLCICNYSIVVEHYI